MTDEDKIYRDAHFTIHIYIINSEGIIPVHVIYSELSITVYIIDSEVSIPVYFKLICQVLSQGPLRDLAWLFHCCAFFYSDVLFPSLLNRTIVHCTASNVLQYTATNCSYLYCIKIYRHLQV